MVSEEKLPHIKLEFSPDWVDYQLLDSGHGKKLEQYGNFTFVRPEAQALWRPSLPEGHWHAVDATFNPGAGERGGNWQFQRRLPKFWGMGYKSLTFQVQITASRHLGVFPEQAPQWDWISSQITAAKKNNPIGSPIRVLNLFGYTGLSTLAAAAAGAHVTHVDASKKAVLWAKSNQELSGLGDSPIRWLVDDAFKFVKREVRRGSQYEAIILDPPKFGRGPKGQVWEFFESLPELLGVCRRLLSPDPLFVVLTAYAIRASAISIHFAMDEMVSELDGTVASGELLLVERSAGRLLPMAIFSRWLNSYIDPQDAKIV